MPENLPTLRKLLAEGCTLETAGSAVGISRSSAHRWIERYGMDAVGRRTKPRLTAEQRELICRLRKRGVSISQTAARSEASRQSVRRIATQLLPTLRRCSGCGGRTLEATCRVCEMRSGVT